MENMRKFNETVKGALVGSDTKRVVNAASEGDLEKYKDAMNLYSWPRTRDYTMVILIFSPLVVAMQVIDNMKEDDESDETVTKFEKLAPLVDNILTRQYMFDLCKYIGEGNGKKIKETLKNFSTYKDLLKALGIKDNVITKLIERAGKITRWVRNREYIEKYITPFVQGALGSKFAAQITKGIVYTNTLYGDPDDREEYRLTNRAGDYLVWDDLDINFPHQDTEEYQSLGSKRRMDMAERRYLSSTDPNVGPLPSRIKITPELKTFFTRFGEMTLGRKVLYITEKQLYEKLEKIITTKVSTYQDLDDVSKAYEKYIGLYAPANTGRFLNKEVYLNDDVSKRLFMKYVMDTLNYSKGRHIDFGKFEEIIELLIDIDPAKLEHANNRFKKVYKCDSQYYVVKLKTRSGKIAKEILQQIRDNFNLNTYDINTLETILKFAKLNQATPYKKAARQRRNSIS